MSALNLGGTASTRRLFSYMAKRSTATKDSGAQDKFSYERAALILVEAAYSTDARAAHRFGVHPLTMENYRARLESDAVLVDLFQKKQAKLEDKWADRVNGAIVWCIMFVERATEEADPSIPENVVAIENALGKLLEARFTKDMLANAQSGKPTDQASEAD